MFKTNPDSMRMEPTPERVLAVCRLIAHNRMTRENVRKAMSLGNNDEKELDQINKSISVAADELDIIKAKDDQLVLTVDSTILTSAVSFRRYVASKVFLQKDSTFYLFTKWVITQNERIFKLKSWEGMAKTCGSEIGELSALNENAVLGWRFWASFLGIGYLSGTMIIPNMMIRLKDVLAEDFTKRFAYGEPILSYEFIVWLSAKLPEVDMSQQRLPLALSAGLKTLHELGMIELKTWRDSDRVALYHVDGDPINDFSHITVKEAVTK